MARFRLRLLLIISAAMWMKLGMPAIAAAPFPNDCNNVCTTSQACAHECYPDLYSFQNNLTITCLTWGIYGSPCCGDSVCDSGETLSCSGDCPPEGCEGEGCDEGEGECGNDQCDGDEDCDSCPEDCGQDCGYCGDQICAANEFGGGGSQHPPGCNIPSESWCDYCEEDCGGCNPYYCDPAVCEDDNGQCRPCEEDSECAFGDEYCAFDGNCYISAECPNGTDLECTTALGPGWVCDTESHVCKPQT
jgi:hypothetical protein